MAYTIQNYVAVGELFDLTDYNQLKNNMAASVPAIFTQKGQISVGTGNKAIASVTPGSNAQAIVVDTAESTGVKFSGGTVSIGMIIIWSGSTSNIPSGWSLCNGLNGTPDLRGKFIVGAGNTYAVGNSGTGNNLAHTHTRPSISTQNAGAHTHTIGLTFSESSHVHATSGTTGNSSDNYTKGWTDTDTFPSSTHAHTWSGNTTAGGAHNHTNPTSGSAGGSHNHAISGTTASNLSTYLPNYYALCFIQRTS